MMHDVYLFSSKLRNMDIFLRRRAKNGRHRANPYRPILFYIGLFSLFVLLSVAEHNIRQDAEDECAGDGGYRDLAEGDGQAADTGDKNNGDNEEVSVIFEVNFLDHLQTADCDEAVERDAHAAHDAGGNRSEESCEG